MANVIPPEVKSDMRAAVRARFILSTSLVLILCAVLVFLMLLPSYVALSQTGAQVSGGAAISPAQQGADKATLTQTTALLSALSPLVSASTTPSQAIAQALSLRPSGVSINQIMYTSGGPSTLVIFGSSKTNGETNTYRSKLASSTVFTSVTVPVGALVGASGGQFSITLSL